MDKCFINSMFWGLWFGEVDVECEWHTPSVILAIWLIENLISATQQIKKG